MSALAPIAKFHADYSVQNLMIWEGRDWIVSLRPGQLTLGAMLISSKLDASSFSAFDSTTGPEFFELVGRCEQAVATLFNAVRVNCIALMMKDPIVHFHLIPRYDAPASYRGRSWPDTDWPKPPIFRDVAIEDEINSALVSDIAGVLAKLG